MKITFKDNKIMTLGGKTFSLVPTMYDVTCEDDGHGSIIATPNRGTKGSLIELSNTPDDGYLFDYYTVDDVQIQGNTFTLQNDCTVFGKFKEEPLPFNTVQIGNQIWSDDLTVDDGLGGIKAVTDPYYTVLIPGTYYYYSIDASVRIASKFSARGWRIPTASDWNTLYSYAGDVVSKLKSTTSWGYGGNGTDNYGFCLLGLGDFYGTTHYYINQEAAILFKYDSSTYKYKVITYDNSVYDTSYNTLFTPLRLVKDA